MNFYKIFEYASYIIDFYLLIISLRILLSWFGGSTNIQGMQILSRITDPFLNVFRRVRFLRFGFLDFSALLGIFLLIFISRLFKHFALGRITLGITLAVFIQTILNGISSVISLIAFITLFRIIGLFIRLNTVKELCYRVDGFLKPLAIRFIRVFFPRRAVPYGAALGCFLVVCILLILLLRFSLFPLLSLISRIPF